MEGRFLQEILYFPLDSKFNQICQVFAQFSELNSYGDQCIYHGVGEMNDRVRKSCSGLIGPGVFLSKTIYSGALIEVRQDHFSMFQGSRN